MSAMKNVNHEAILIHFTNMIGQERKKFQHFETYCCKTASYTAEENHGLKKS